MSYPADGGTNRDDYPANSFWLNTIKNKQMKRGLKRKAD